MCTACGVVPVVTSRIDGRLYAVVSVNAFENVRIEHTCDEFAIAGIAQRGNGSAGE